ncbi:hypothetical protein EYV94_27940 [Puteibacter caeruleilacunae]|nr:hypothetical protein EYV94_27940 [Puteibacter caeruleilacunae]
MRRFLFAVLLTVTVCQLNAQTQVGNSDSPIYYNNGNVGIGIAEPNAQLVVGNYFGTIISGCSAGRGVVGSNLAVYQGGENHGKLYTPYTHTNGHGYCGIDFEWGKITFHAQRGNTTADQLVSSPQMYIHWSGKVGIGTTSPDYLLDVNGTMRAKEVKVNLNEGPDYVFEDDYDLKSLEEVDQFVKERKHLPDVPSAKQMEKEGIGLAEMNKLLLQKVEELTLYTIKQEKEIAGLKSDRKEFIQRLNDLEQLLKANHK